MNRILQHLLVCAGLLLAAGTTQAESSCRYNELAALDLSIDPRGQPYIDASINDKPVHMLIDTGAYKTLLTRAEADRQQLPLTRTSERLSGLGGRADMFSARPNEVVIGPTRVRKAVFPVVEGFDYPGYGGIIGADYLLQADLEVALADRKLKFFRADGCDDKSLAYWDTQALDVPIDILSRDGRVVVPVEVNGVKLMALIDTGAAVSVMDEDTAAKLGVKRDTESAGKSGRLVGVSGKTREAWKATFDSFAIGEERIDKPRLTVVGKDQEFSQRNHDMVLGRDFLRAHRVLISMRQQRFYYSYLGGAVFSPAR